MVSARTLHILTDSKVKCDDLKKQIEEGANFQEIAKIHSLCPSGVKGGDLGLFDPGEMVPEFDKVVFSNEVGIVHGPVKTQFGFHLIKITSRTN